MGSGSSRVIEWGTLEEHPLILRLLNEKVTAADPLWNQLLSFRVPLMSAYKPEIEKGEIIRILNKL